jgi:hypothetical protein
LGIFHKFSSLVAAKRARAGRGRQAMAVFAELFQELMALQGPQKLKYMACPPLILFKPETKAEEHAREVHDGHSHHEHVRALHPAAKQGQHSAVWVILSIAMVMFTLYRFSEDGSLTEREAKDLLIGAYRAPDGAEARVSFFWFVVMLALTAATYTCRPDHVHTIDHMLIPEILALGFFFCADFIIESIRTIDQNADGMIEWHEVVEGAPRVVMNLPNRWIWMNMGMVLSATLIQTIVPVPYTMEAVVYNIGWSLALVQGVAFFLFSSVRRGQDLHDWGSTFASVMYGPALYCHTHGLALLSAVVFRKHEGAEHPPTLIKVAKALSQFDPRYILHVAAVLATLLAVNVLPPLVDHSASCARASEGEYCPPVWLQSVTKGLFAGPFTALSLSLVNLIAVRAASRCANRPVAQAPHASYESVLTWTTGCIATFCWCELMMPESGAPQWKFLSVGIGAVAHFAIAATSADVFSGRMEPTFQEAVVLTFWAATQCFQGLCVEHHAALEHVGHHDHGLSVNGLLVHLGEFGLCEFGLITTLGWVTLLTEKVVHMLPVHNKKGLRQPLLSKHH